MSLDRRQVLVGLASAGAVACGPTVVDREDPGVHELRDRIHGKNRVSTLIVPTGLQARVPLLIGLHDTGDRMQTVYEDQGWQAECARRGWIAAFPQNLKPGDKDDNAYLAHLIGRAVALGGADPQRVFVVGHGAGGRRAYALACANPDLLTAVGACSAAIRYDETDLGWQDPKAPATSIVHIHGGQDARVPVAGGPSVGSDGRTRTVQAAERALKPWVDLLAGTATAGIDELPDRVRSTRWIGGDREVLLVIDPAQGSAWNASFATRLMAGFFARAPAR